MPTAGSTMENDPRSDNRPRLSLSFSPADLKGPSVVVFDAALPGHDSGSFVLSPTSVPLPNLEALTIAATCDPATRGFFLHLSQGTEALAIFTGYLCENRSPNPVMVARTLLGASVDVAVLGF